MANGGVEADGGETQEEQKMREVIGDAEQWGEAAKGYTSQATIKRFLDSEDWNVSKASKKLLRALQWRYHERPWAQTCSDCAANPRAHSLRLIGFDALQRPVIYTNFAEAECSSHTTTNVEHLTRICEDAERLMLKHGFDRYGKWVWATDFHGFSMADGSPQSALAAAKLLDKFPERLSQAFLIDPPSLFWGVWSIAKQVLHTRTRNKVVFLTMDELPTKAAEMGEEMYTWLQNEGNENRWLWKTAEGQKQLPKRYWRAPTNGHKHDPRGVSSFVNSDDFFLPTEWPGGEYDPDTILDKRLKQQQSYT